TCRSRGRPRTLGAAIRGGSVALQQLETVRIGPGDSVPQPHLKAAIAAIPSQSTRCDAHRTGISRIHGTPAEPSCQPLSPDGILHADVGCGSGAGGTRSRSGALATVRSFRQTHPHQLENADPRRIVATGTSDGFGGFALVVGASPHRK